MRNYPMQFFVKRHGLFDWRVHVRDNLSGWSGYVAYRHFSQTCALRACDDLTQWYRTGFDHGAHRCPT